MKSSDGGQPPLAPETYQLQGLLQAKDDFLRLAVHEFRGPVGRIGGYLSMINGGDLGEISEPLRKVISQTENDVEQLNLFLERLASVAQIEDHAAILQRSSCGVSALVEEAIGMVKIAASIKQISIEREEKYENLEIEADPYYFQIAISNLLSNAVKYSQKSSTITISVSGHNAGIDIAVGDEGPGVGPADAELIFDKYWRGNSSSGLGLGLYLVRRIMELHGGRITVVSEPTKGSCFTISLPPEAIVR
ncbi:MAG: sensor histidine kinase [Rhabdochlamydiaceae bacterium]